MLYAITQSNSRPLDKYAGMTINSLWNLVVFSSIKDNVTSPFTKSYTFLASFLSLVTNNANLSDAEILSMYGNEIFNKYKKVRNETTNLLENEKNNKLAINVNLNLRVVKNAKNAQLTFAISKDAEDSVYIVDKIKDINTTYPYSQKNARELIMNNLRRKDIEINLHQSNFNLICNKYNL